MKPPLYFECSAFMSSPSPVLIFSPKTHSFSGNNIFARPTRASSAIIEPFTVHHHRWEIRRPFAADGIVSPSRVPRRGGGVIPRFLQEIKFLCCSHPECGRSANECSAITLPSRTSIISARSASGVVCKTRRSRGGAVFISPHHRRCLRVHWFTRSIGPVPRSPHLHEMRVLAQRLVTAEIRGRGRKGLAPSAPSPFNARPPAFKFKHANRR